VTVDCDVLQADGGTRTASITGGYIALAVALTRYGMERHLRGHIAAVSVGIVDGRPLLDLDYAEDSHAEVDFNVVGTDARVRRARDGGREAVRPRLPSTRCSTSRTGARLCLKAGVATVER
jgi:hypothetical protein